MLVFLGTLIKVAWFTLGHACARRCAQHDLFFVRNGHLETALFSYVRAVTDAGRELNSNCLGLP